MISCTGGVHWVRGGVHGRVTLENGDGYRIYGGTTVFPQIDIIGAVVIVWRVRGKIVRSVLCSIVCNNCTQ